jgi:hypothetical protein
MVRVGHAGLELTDDRAEQATGEQPEGIRLHSKSPSRRRNSGEANESDRRRLSGRWVLSGCTVCGGGARGACRSDLDGCACVSGNASAKQYDEVY